LFTGKRGSIASAALGASEGAVLGGVEQAARHPIVAKAGSRRVRMRKL
jgi:hypothetical protein